MSQKFGRFSDPRDPRRPERISLAYGGWKDIPSRIANKYGYSVTELDLSHNKFLYPLDVLNFMGIFRDISLTNMQIPRQVRA